MPEYFNREKDEEPERFVLRVRAYLGKCHHCGISWYWGGNTYPISAIIDKVKL